MIRPHSIDLLDLVRERRGLVDEQLQELVRRALAREQLELAVYRARPCGNDAERDLRPESIQSVSWSARSGAGAICGTMPQCKTLNTHDDGSHRVQVCGHAMEGGEGGVRVSRANGRRARGESGTDTIGVCSHRQT